MMERKTLSERMAEQIREGILAGLWKVGDTLPTEPELAELFGVSRAVVRDATRIVTAWGLVEPRQGKGVYITGDHLSAFSDALLLAMRRVGGSAWDVEQVESFLLPEAAAIAAARADEIDFANLRLLLDAYGEALKAQAGKETPGFTSATRDAFLDFMTAFYEASGNRLISYLGPAITRIRKPRHFQDSPGVHPVTEYEDEIRLISLLLDLVETGDPVAVRSGVAEALEIHTEVEKTLRSTAIGEIPQIPMTLEDLRH